MDVNIEKIKGEFKPVALILKRICDENELNINFGISSDNGTFNASIHEIKNTKILHGFKLAKIISLLSELTNTSFYVDLDLNGLYLYVFQLQKR